MASFASVADALHAAQTVQVSFADHNRHHPDDALHLRIGLAAGEPIEEHGDLFGHAVQLAARLCALAEPGQILTSAQICDLTDDLDLDCVDEGWATLKGFDEEVHVFSVPWGTA